MAQERVSFSEVLRVRLPVSVSDALARVAAEDLTTVIDPDGDGLGNTPGSGGLY